jgi:hypothetical protein
LCHQPKSQQKATGDWQAEPEHGTDYKTSDYFFQEINDSAMP